MPESPSRTPQITWLSGGASREPGQSTNISGWADQSQEFPPNHLPPTPLLDNLGRDLTALAQRGELKEIFGREREVLQVARALLRREKANPLLVGPPGVGKTAIVEALAQRVSNRTVHPQLQSLRFVEVSIPSLIAGTSFRGAMEERILTLMNELRQRPDIILFLDEFHLIVGAGMVSGSQLDLANIFKPALVRGELRCIGATTPNEYERAVRHDPAMERRMLPIRIGEPSTDETLSLLAQVAPAYQAFYGVLIDPEALSAVVGLSAQYLPDRRLPDKAFELLDDACSRIALPNLDGTPEGISTVTVEAVAAALTDRTGIPLAHLTERTLGVVPELEARLSAEVVGQPAAVHAVASAVRIAASGLRASDRPRGILLFGGPTGVGKTSMAKALAGALFGDERALLRIDLSEYQERHSVSRLVGAPPGYVGHDGGGQLTDHLRRTPHCVVLLDEIEKAHPSVLDLFLQVFDAGRITDAHGHTADARHAYFLLTTNLPITQNQQELRHHLRPEFVNRIDQTVIFVPLTTEDLSSIARRQLDALNSQLASQHLGLRVTAEDSALACLCQPEVIDGTANGRSVLRHFERDIVLPLSNRLSSGEMSSVHLNTRIDENGKCHIILIEFDALQTL
jgi:ATP-dependent Clp protease ATP-binding subunit ClpA